MDLDIHLVVQLLATVALTGSGSGCTITVSESAGVASVNSVITGNGYQVGDVLTVDNSHSGVIRGAGLKFVVNAIDTTFDTFI